MSEPVEVDVLRDMLGLVGKNATLTRLRSWTPAQRAEAAAWAAAVHLRASDNIVRVPRMPAHVARLVDEGAPGWGE